MDLISVGEMVIDFLPGKEAGSFLQKAGGAPANLAIAMARLGLKTGFAGRVGADKFGEFLWETLAREKVAILCPEPVEAATTTMAFVHLDDEGERSFTFARKPGADRFLERCQIDALPLEDVRLLHAGGCGLSEEPAADATRYAMEQAKALDKLVSFDVNYRALMWKNERQAAIHAFQEVAHLVDILKLSDEEEDFVGSLKELPAFAKAHEIDLVLYSQGSQGLQVFWKEGWLAMEGHDVPVVDSTGAGDAAFGAFLAILLEQDLKTLASLTQPRLQAAMQAANAAGALCVQKKGAIASLPKREALRLFLKEAANHDA